MGAMSDSASTYLNLHVPPDEMVKYIQDLMTLPHGEIAASSALTLAQRQWGARARSSRVARPPAAFRSLRAPRPTRPPTADDPLAPSHYKRRLGGLDALCHVTIEVETCTHEKAEAC